MKERPILFSAPMVRAILAGTKTQTRRVVKDNECPNLPSEIQEERELLGKPFCPYGDPGDRLWVRESGWERPERTARMMREGADTWPRFAYAADAWNDQDRADFKAWGFKPRPSIHMPRWASRILLEIVSVRVERLQEISEADAIAEGIKGTCDGAFHVEDDRFRSPSAIESYARLWESINGPGSWAANPFVWVVEFKRVTHA